MNVATGGRTYVTADLMYVAVKNKLVAKNCCFFESQPVLCQKDSVIRSPSYARRSGHRRCPPAYQ